VVRVLGYRSGGPGSIFGATRKKVVGLERGPLSLVSTTEELLERKSRGSGLESREYGRRDPSRCPLGTLYPQKLAITSPTSGGRSVGIVLSRTQTMEFSFSFLVFILPDVITLLSVYTPLILVCKLLRPFSMQPVSFEGKSKR
jgi:hypothetical protein